MKNKNQLLFEAECYELTRTLNEYDKKFNNSKNQISMDNIKFTIPTLKGLSDDKEIPDQKVIKAILANAKKKQLLKNIIIIARYQWLVKHKLMFPENMELPNLCLTIKKGKLIRAFYSNVLSHIIKKQNYYIQILN